MSSSPEFIIEGHVQRSTRRRSYRGRIDKIKKEGKKRALTSGRGDDLIQKFRVGPLPDFLDDGTELLVGLVDVACACNGDGIIKNDNNNGKATSVLT